MMKKVPRDRRRIKIYTAKKMREREENQNISVEEVEITLLWWPLALSIKFCRRQKMILLMLVSERGENLMQFNKKKFCSWL